MSANSRPHRKRCRASESTPMTLSNGGHSSEQSRAHLEMRRSIYAGTPVLSRGASTKRCEPRLHIAEPRLSEAQAARTLLRRQRMHDPRNSSASNQADPEDGRRSKIGLLVYQNVITRRVIVEGAVKLAPKANALKSRAGPSKARQARRRLQKLRPRWRRIDRPSQHRRHARTSRARRRSHQALRSRAPRSAEFDNGAKPPRRPLSPEGAQRRNSARTKRACR